MFQAALLGFTAAAAATLLPAPGVACSGVPCGIQFAPGGVTVPANLPGFSLESAPAAVVTVTSLDGSESVALDAELRLQQELTPGQTYGIEVRVQAASNCPAEYRSTLMAGPPAPLPTSLGEPRVVAQGRGPTAVGFTPGSCFSDVDSAFVDLEPSLEPDASPWRDAIFDVRALVDGKPYWLSAEAQPQETFYPTQGNGYRPFTGGDLRVRVFVACEDIAPESATSYVQLAEGAHRVKLAGTLAGGGVLETTETEITLRCSAAEIEDAGVAEEASDDATPARSQRGGSCSALPGRAEHASLVMLGLLALATSLSALRVFNGPARPARPIAGRPAQPNVPPPRAAA